jgi:hypothetical protein
MTYTGGIKPGATPGTNKVENNSPPGSGTPQGGVSPGWLKPAPNTTWMKGVVKTDAETMKKREAFIAQGAMGMHQAVKVTVDSAAQLSAHQRSPSVRNRPPRQARQPLGIPSSRRRNRAKQRSRLKRNMTTRWLHGERKSSRICIRTCSCQRPERLLRRLDRSELGEQPLCFSLLPVLTGRRWPKAG